MEPRERAASLIRRCQQIATSIYPLADHAGFRSGDGAVSGETADTAHELEGLNKRLWARFDELRHWCDKLAHAGGRPDEEIEALLSTRVKLDDAGFPIRHGLRSARSHIGLASLADKLTVEAENLLSATNRFDAACGRIADKVVKVTSLLSQIERDASIHGMQDNHELVRLRDQVRPVVDAALTDPLGQSDEPFDVLEAELTAFTGFINRLEALSTDYPERLAGLGAGHRRERRNRTFRVGHGQDRESHAQRACSAVGGSFRACRRRRRARRGRQLARTPTAT